MKWKYNNKITITGKAIKTTAEHAAQNMAAIFYAIFCIPFTFISMNLITYTQADYNVNGFLVFLYTLILISACIILFKAIQKHYEAVLKIEPYIVILVIIMLFISHMLAGRALRFESAFDFASVYKGAIMWTETGSFKDYYEYYCYFPNNLGAMALLRFFFVVARSVGIKDYYMAGVLLNSIIIILTVFFSYLTARRMFPPAGGIICIIFFVISPPFWILSAAFYTDSLSMLFPVLFLYIYVSDKSIRGAEGAAAFRHRFNITMMAVVIVIGTAIKGTVIIMAAAVIIDMLISGSFKKAAVTFCAIACAFMAFQTSFNSYIYKYHINEELSYKMSTPVSHWIMMGLNPASGGAYSAKDYEFTRSFDDVSKRNEAIAGEIKSRIREQGFTGLSALFSKKLIKAFGDGTYAISDFLDDSPINPGKIHSYVLYNGEHYSTYKYLTQPPIIAAYIFMIIGAVKACIAKDRNFIAQYAAVFGLMLFLAIWESSSRYFLNFVPVIFLCAVCGASLGLRKQGGVIKS